MESRRSEAKEPEMDKEELIERMLNERLSDDEDVEKAYREAMGLARAGLVLDCEDEDAMRCSILVAELIEAGRHDLADRVGRAMAEYGAEPRDATGCRACDDTGLVDHENLCSCDRGAERFRRYEQDLYASVA